MTVHKRVVKIKITPKEAAEYVPANKGIVISWAYWNLEEGTCIVIVTGSDMILNTEEQVDANHIDDEVYSRLAFYKGQQRLVEDSLPMPDMIPANKPVMRISAFLSDQRINDLPRDVKNIKEQYQVAVKPRYLDIINKKMEEKGLKKLDVAKTYVDRDTDETMQQLDYGEIENG